MPLPGLLLHSPADIIRNLMISMSMGSSPSLSQAWPIYVANEPSLPDNCITVFDVIGRPDGRTQINGEIQEHHGFQVRLRGVDHPTGYAKARAVSEALDKNVYREGITISGTTYCIHSVSRLNDIICLGTESPTTKRCLFVINYITYLIKTS